MACFGFTLRAHWTKQKTLVVEGVRVPSTTSIRPGKSLLMIPARVVLAMQDDS
jgi:hypothetical protein